VESVITLLGKFEYSMRILNKLENEFKKYIRTKVVILESNKIDLCRNVYSNFFKELCAVTNCSLGEDGNPFKYTGNKWTFFTTNYDNIIEDFWVNYRGYYLLDLGFSYKEGKKIMNVEGFVENNRNNSYGAMQLVKLHGSVNWIRNRNGEVQEFGYNFSYDDILPRAGSMDFKDDVMIYPVSQKQLFINPFSQLFVVLEEELQKREIWIVIGYSFRDIVIRALEANKKRKLLLIHPHAKRNVKCLFTKKVEDQVLCLDRYFAKQDYENVNREVAKTLVDLS
jgi:hypothetical protein